MSWMVVEKPDEEEPSVDSMKKLKRPKHEIQKGKLSNPKH